jgi:hypothetical protein
MGSIITKIKDFFNICKYPTYFSSSCCDDTINIELKSEDKQEQDRLTFCSLSNCCIFKREVITHDNKT